MANRLHWEKGEYMDKKKPWDKPKVQVLETDSLKEAVKKRETPKRRKS